MTDEIPPKDDDEKLNGKNVIPFKTTKELEAFWSQDLVVAKTFGGHLPTPYIDPLLTSRRAKEAYAKRHMKPNGEPMELYRIYEAEDFYSFDDGTNSLDETDRFKLSDER